MSDRPHPWAYLFKNNPEILKEVSYGTRSKSLGKIGCAGAHER